MIKSDSIKALTDALAKAQAEMKNPHFDATNPHFKNKFASLGAVRSSVIPVFTKYGLAFSQWPVSEGNYAGCVNHLAHASGEWQEERFLIPVDKLTAHSFASAVTYAKRISMQSVAGVVGDEDDDGNAAVGDNVNGKGKVGSGLTDMKDDALAALSVGEREMWKRIAADVESLTEEGRSEEAFQLIEDGLVDVRKADKENDTDREITVRLALWNMLGSKARAAVKKASKTIGAGAH